MSLRIPAAAILLLLSSLLPVQASARALSREGIVGILPSATFGSPRGGGESGSLAPGATLAFGFKPSAPIEVGIDVSASTSNVSGADGRSARVWSVPFLLRFSWTPTPKWDLRPVFHVGAGKALITVDGPSSYEEHTPLAAQATVGIQADLSDTMGLWADAGYLYARATDSRLGTLDTGGPVARVGLYFRWEPIPERGFGSSF